MYRRVTALVHCHDCVVSLARVLIGTAYGDKRTAEFARGALAGGRIQGILKGTVQTIASFRKDVHAASSEKSPFGHAAMQNIHESN